MPFRMLEGEGVVEGIRRICSEQVERAIGELDDSDLGTHETVHEVRKRCKKIRGVARLVRPHFADYSSENTHFRDAARELSYIRDAEAIIETFDDLMEKFADQIDQEALAGVRQALQDRRDQITDDGTLLEKLEDFRDRMVLAQSRIENWDLSAGEFEAFRPGLLKTYRRARKAMNRAYSEPSVEIFHEWRKRVKYHRYHTRLLREIWPPLMEPLRNEVKLLSDLLGDDHDLAVFAETLLASPKEFGAPRTVQLLLGLIDRRSAELRSRSETLGKRIFVDKPKALGRRFNAYWEAWRQEISSPLAKLS